MQKIYYNDVRNHRCSTDTQFHYVWPQVYYFKGASYNIIARSNDYVHQTSDKKWPSYTVEPV